MRFSAIGSRGDVQPVVALASHLKAPGHEVRVCMPPDFREWVESLGILVTPIGPEVQVRRVSFDGHAAANAADGRAAASDDGSDSPDTVRDVDFCRKSAT